MQLGRWIHTRAMLVGMSLLLGGCATPSTTREQALDRLLADPALAGASVSLMVRDARSGSTLYQHNPRTRLVPASSLKLLTTAAAMDVLGPQYRFSTQLLSNGRQQGARLMGNLYLRGLGDPTIQWADYQALAAKLAGQGIRQVTGDLVFDDSWFDAERLGVDWAHDDEDKYYGAQISALTVSPNADFDAGTLIVTARAPAAIGQAVSVSLSPATDYVQLSNLAVSGPGNSYGLNRQHGSNLLRLSGALQPGTQSRQWVSVWEPTQLVANLFERALAEQGITVQGRRVIGGVSPEVATVLAVHESAPLQELIRPLLKLSNNSMAEALLKAMGRKQANAGTAAAGVVAVADFLRRQGMDPATLNQVDGSGLSRRNLVSAQNFTDLLLAMGKQPWFNAWYDALPIAGNPDRLNGGSLRYRLRGTAAQDNLQAKTGSMGGVSSLTGYITDAGGRRLVFSMLTNNYVVEGSRIKALEDRLATILCRSELAREGR
ncbi:MULTISPECIES: D-alanyl-D-alanine carboxypeptidase/D-alanyl-D-alanine-endopeptidase [Pseudomonas]|uniref:D-alanyl-D-alanine carboxypeptidase / D-alanyl-D-alanine-endopeptidase (Penicillin-binding protein 4) n=1 Tax=Pseudomonas brenneri TaxID=129817 RepID=A0A5B2ULQ1_9PSED|nr:MULTISPECIES: D-alanyl-D-alanine carboxypeptidase/D-alanyl-D-alanine-endopeptidase [Pseudomonas]KAA2226909.1 D-alanyl-D-alanine carboxypeptidase/D-alanyl-D-alanine-endopeptidase [Pseudomonas brenneri]TWR75465.1 D-alanyl-D-alanine carboxypeptidase/D-alanyl-D-alanine-endopeptidase [Pseudomonas brenneri]CRM83760.1 D-alanyl-D-alanine carboxypeptidase DacC precursor [Pseudomonas sp. 25 R 14]SDV13073.1 D-alanyl-D-alanine carboxypeptidase / D-alanyl-D-alanine-endopeptidase (penicillin-binding prote